VEGTRPQLHSTAANRIEPHSSAPLAGAALGMHRAAQCWIMLLFLAPTRPGHVTHIGPATVHVCVRTTRSNKKRYNSKTPQVRLRFMFHYRIPQVTPFLHDPICNRSGCMRNPFRGGVSW
jgi:hypothetical protein